MQRCVGQADVVSSLFYTAEGGGGVNWRQKTNPTLDSGASSLKSERTNFDTANIQTIMNRGNFLEAVLGHTCLPARSVSKKAALQTMIARVAFPFAIMAWALIEAQARSLGSGKTHLLDSGLILGVPSGRWRSSWDFGPAHYSMLKWW